jgi:hypothetical protein
MTNQPKTVEECNDMATKALARLTRWAFPDSKIERKNEHIW